MCFDDEVVWLGAADMGITSTNLQQESWSVSSTCMVIQPCICVVAGKILIFSWSSLRWIILVFCSLMCFIVVCSSIVRC